MINLFDAQCLWVFLVSMMTSSTKLSTEIVGNVCSGSVLCRYYCLVSAVYSNFVLKFFELMTTGTADKELL
ncbi:hypothetical protein GZ77_00840 [Endozoicomonas montiporae]|uniref:Uncharacterized protein n=2 Tax=Endozoicomonas montiporae TaxID=1027273 RepID=A0A081N9Y7_9GAMM|nr:hypothetical protein EZMO1_3053 [Endozoicomonas montiporae CL-33]KEQ15260.1 hypothetical protein GZ77_00840 [Endozoicomonas montiporae]